MPRTKGHELLFVTTVIDTVFNDEGFVADVVEREVMPADTRSEANSNEVKLVWTYIPDGEYVAAGDYWYQRRDNVSTCVATRVA